MSFPHVYVDAGKGFTREPRAKSIFIKGGNPVTKNITQTGMVKVINQYVPVKA